jgi:oligoendopeptidase F
MSTATALPNWDMTVYFPSLDSDEFRAEYEEVVGDIAELEALFDKHGVDRGEGLRVDSDLVRRFDEILHTANNLNDRVRTVGAFIHSFVTTDSRDEEAQSRLSEFQQHTSKLYKLDTRFTAWVGSMDVEALISQSRLAEEHAHPLRVRHTMATRLMSPAEEALASDLSLSGGTAWAKLQGNLSSQILVEVSLDGELRKLPMSMARNLAYDTDREVRRRAYEAELATWKEHETVFAACMNGVKGEVGAVSDKRGWETPLDHALMHAAIDRETLDAMLGAAHEAFPHFRRYLRAKARALGIEKAAWYDIFAPVGDEAKEWDYDEAERFVEEKFRTYSDKLGDFAARSFRERWTDAGPREGKRDGAFCMGTRGDESRILMNYKPSFGSVSTLAHELGHGYHNVCLAGARPSSARRR